MKLSLIRTLFSLGMLVSSTSYATCNPYIALNKPTSIYTVHGNGTVTDIETGLMWQQCSLGLSGVTCATGTATTYHWKAALEAAQTANDGAGTFGYTDWRLPSIAELRTLVEKACYNPSINMTVFPNISPTTEPYGWSYWSASPYTENNIEGPNFRNAWDVSFSDGDEFMNSKGNGFFVRLVRGGQ